MCFNVCDSFCASTFPLVRGIQYLLSSNRKQCPLCAKSLWRFVWRQSFFFALFFERTKKQGVAFLYLKNKLLNGVSQGCYKLFHFHLKSSRNDYFSCKKVAWWFLYSIFLMPETSMRRWGSYQTTGKTLEVSFFPLEAPKSTVLEVFHGSFNLLIIFSRSLVHKLS